MQLLNQKLIGNSSVLLCQFTVPLPDWTVPVPGGYDGAGNLLSVNATFADAFSAYSGNTSFTYNTQDELTQESTNRAVFPPSWLQTYLPDASFDLSINTS